MVGESVPVPGVVVPSVRRRTRVPGGRGHRRHDVKVTAAEHERLMELAAAAGMSVPRLLVESALAGGPDSAAARAATSAELVALGRALGRVGVNVNQIARATNATGEVQDATENALAVIGEVAARLAVVLDGIDAARVARRVAG